MQPRILLVNPPIYDFTAYDFWLKPFGMLTAAACLRRSADLTLFDYLDRNNPYGTDNAESTADKWGRGHFQAKKIDKPKQFASIHRNYRRFGAERSIFQSFIKKNIPFDHVLVQTSMTYWYPGVMEVIEDIRSFLPGASVVLGGTYVGLCPEHAKTLGADILIPDSDTTFLESLVPESGKNYQSPLWELYEKLDVGVIKLTRGCPYHCTYCGVHLLNSGGFKARPLTECIKDLQILLDKGVTDIAFYDDALLYQPDKTLIPFLEYVIAGDIKVNFHTPNALHVRFITPEIANIMVRGGFKTFYLGFESKSGDFHSKTGSKVVSRDLVTAAENLINAGADKKNITTYQIIGHPNSDLQQLEESMRFANSLGLKVMLADFSPIPSTPDGDYCKKYTDLDEPLNHNKTAFPIIHLGTEKVNHFKSLCKKLNRSL
ncbi:MAG: radical SAM protein [Planctomycetes bacterium]|nr:radical SAM protein [Planctomycetota bacterium]